MLPHQNYTSCIFKRAVWMILLLFAAGLPVAVANAGIVTNTADSGAGSLRQIIATAASGDTITFATNLSGSTITLFSGQLTLGINLTIDASALPAGIEITSPGSRIFSVAGTANVTLTALTITGGMDQTHLGGGGIYNGGFLNLNRCTVSGNSAPNALANCGGGGIFNSNVLVISQSTITGNSSDGDTTANSGGGGIYNGNANLIVNQSTITGNHADSDTFGGGGIYNASGNVNIFNSIVAANTDMGTGADIYTVVNFSLSGANIIENVHGNYSGTAPFGAAPQLALLGNYGGPTPTMPPLPSSIAINNCYNTQNFTNDQRGAPMVSQGVADIGSVELDPPTVATLPAAAVNTNATLNATVNPNTLATTAWFQWGITNNPYASQTTPMALGAVNAALAFSNNLTSLTAGVVYHCRVVASNVDGVANGSDVLFGSAPIVTLLGPAAITNECHTLFNDPGATNAAGLPVTVTGVVHADSPNIYQLTYTATNSLGLSDSAIRLVYVVDTTPPVITILGANPLTIPTNTPFVDPGATALDACGGSFAVTASGGVNSAVVGTYLITYSSTDSYGNTATAVRTVVVRNYSILVSNANDSGAGSLRQAIVSALGGDYIQFATNLSGATILLTNGQMTITTNLTIDASTLPGGIQINGRRAFSIFAVNPDVTVEFTGLTISNGFSFTENGGAIYNDGGTVTLNQCLLGENLMADSGYGGAIFNGNGTMTVNQCTFTGNSATGDGGGGGIFNYLYGTLTVNQCTFTGNSATGGAGGGIFNYNATLTVNKCTFTGNSANDGEGGAIANYDGTLTVNECTFVGNSSDTNGAGGGIGSSIDDDTNAVYINQSTLTGNHADYDTNYGGGGIYTLGPLYISNSIIAGNTTINGSGADVYGNNSGADISFCGANIVQGLYGYGGANPPINADPKLAMPGNYGGPTQTCPPLPGSPAIDACESSSFTTDQRGFPRILDTFPDIGAVEGVYNSSGPGRLINTTRLANGGSQFEFTSFTDSSFTVLASTNVSLPMAIWMNLGTVMEAPIGSGQYQFTDPQATNFPQRFYRVRSP